MIKVDTTTLSNLINQCFGFATDARVPAQAQAAFLADGKRLRGLLLNLLSAQFDDATQAVVEANSELAEVNNRLADSVSVLANAAQALNNVASVVASLDRLLNVAVTFV